LSTYVTKRLIAAALTTWGIVTVVFVALHITPGNPISSLLPPNLPASETQVYVRRLEAKYGFDRPLYVQYALYLGQLARGDLGTSISTGRPVAQDLLQKYPATIELAVTSFLLAVLVGTVVGILAAVRKGTAFDRASMAAAMAGLAMPTFWLGYLLMILFAIVLHWLPPSGRPLDPWTADGLKHLILPALTLAVPGTGLLARFVRSAVLEVAGEDYVRTARAKGLGERAVIYRHVVRNGLIPVVTVMGLQLGELLAGAVVVEDVFSWPGVGNYLVTGISAKDFPVVQGCVLFVAVTFVLGNLAVDLLYTVLDPRITYA
jgi:peptide/nickel transport system permease protein